MKRDAPRLRRLTTPVVVCALAVAGYGQVLVPDTIPYSPHSDIVAYHLAAKQVLHRSLEAGHGLPFWRGDQLSGTPAFTSPNALYTNPLHFLYFILDPIRATGFTIALLLVAGAYAFYLVGLALRLSAWPRILMAVAGLFSFKLILAVYAGWLGPLCALVTFPLLFASAFFTARNPSARAGLALAGSAALCLHGGQLQVVYYAAWFALAYLVVAGVRLWRQGERPAARRLAAWSAFAGFMAIAMSLYILCPMAAEASLMSRVRASDSFMQSGHALGFRHLLTLFSPEILGTPLDGSYAGVELWEDVAYFGLVPLVLALVGALLGHRRPSVKFLAAGFVLCLLLALDSPLARAAYRVVPGMNLFRLPGRILFLAAFFGIALAGIGLEEILAHLRRQGGRLPSLVAAALLLIVAGEGIANARRYVGTAAPSVALPKAEWARFLAHDKDFFRVAPLARTAMSYGSAASMGLSIVSGYEPYNLGHYQEYFHLMQFGDVGPSDAVVWTDLRQVARWDLLDALAVKYVVSSLPTSLPADHFELAGRFSRQSVHMFYKGARQTDIFVYRNRRARPRAFLVDRVVTVPDHEAALAATTSTSLANTAIVETPETTIAEPAPGGEEAGNVLVADAGDGRLEVDATTHARRFLVLAEVWHPGWHAHLDGKEVPLLRTDIALMGSWLAPGSHHLSLVFSPLHFRLALAISLIALGLFVAGGLWLVGQTWWKKNHAAPGTDA